jgi:lipoyl-dependent peroxiredoxin
MPRFSRHAILEWHGNTMNGSGSITAGSGPQTFSIPATFPRVAGDPLGATTPEEMLAASHAICFGIGLRSVIAQRGGSARRVKVTATITAEKGAQGIRILASHLEGLIEGLEGIPASQVAELTQATEAGCTISIALRGSVAITSHVVAL